MVLGGIVSYLENVVNAAAPTEMPRLGDIFERALRYEVAFWDMAYHGEKWL